MKWSFTNIDHEVRKQLGVSMNEYCVCDIIFKSQVNSNYSTDGWSNLSYRKLSAFFDLTTGAIHKMIDRLFESGIIEVNPSNPQLKKVTQKWIQATTEGCSKNEQGVQKVNGRCSKSEQKRSKSEHNKIKKTIINKERERAHEKENNIQPKQKNVPSKVAAKVSLDINPLKYETTAIFFANQLQDTFPASITELQKIVDGKIGDHIKSYFRNLQKKSEWYQLQEPDESRMNSWISKHYAGVEMWLKNEKKFWPTKEGKSKVKYESPKNVFTADQLKKSA